MNTGTKLQQFLEISLYFRQFNVFFDHFVAFWHKILCKKRKKVFETTKKWVEKMMEK